MEKLKETEHAEDEEEYVLLDLDSVACQVDIPPNAPYVLSGLDTLNPVLIIGDKLKLENTKKQLAHAMFSRKVVDTAPVVHEETGASEANLFMGKCIVDPNQAPTKKVKPVTSLQKIIKFRLSPEVDPLASAVEPTDFNL